MRTGDRRDERPLLSVIVPAYNVEASLRKCISSLILPKEMRKEAEILIIDDGSLDTTPELAETWKKRYPEQIRVIHKENGGHGSAINTGIAAAKGKYLRVVDGDDWVDTQQFLSFVRKLKYLECDAVITRFAIVTEQDGEKRKSVREPVLPRMKYGRIYLFQDICARSYIKMHELTLRTALLKKHNVRVREHSFYVDMEYILYPIPYIRHLCVLPECVYQYRMGGQGQSVSLTGMQRNRIQHEVVLEDLLTFFRSQEEAGASKEILLYLAGGIARMEANQIKLYLSCPTTPQWKNKLILLDRRIQREYPLIYRKMPKKSVWLLRLSRYRLYGAAARCVRLAAGKTGTCTDSGHERKPERAGKDGNECGCRH